MKRVLLTLLLVPAVAAAQQPLAPERRTALEAKLATVAKKYNIQCVFPTAKGSTGLSYTYSPVTTTNDKTAETLVDLFIEEFAKYPVDFIKASKLKRVLFVEDLAVRGQRRAAVPDGSNEDLLYDPVYVSNTRYMRHVIHHEFYHMLEQEWNGDPYYRDPNWMFLNTTGFAYGAGGANAYGKGDVWSFVHPQTGFINLYSTYGPEEDKAEVWAVMFVPENWKLVNPFLADDAVLRAKVSYLREYARSKSPAMDGKFWSTVGG